MERLQIVQNRALRLIGGYSWYTRIEKMHLDFEIPTHKTCIKSLTMKLRLINLAEIDISKS